MSLKASSEEELYSWLVPLRVLVGSHNLVRTGAGGSMCYVDVARRVELVNTRNRCVCVRVCSRVALVVAVTVVVCVEAVVGFYARILWSAHQSALTLWPAL